MYLAPRFAAVAARPRPYKQTIMASSARIEELRKKFEENPRRYFAPLANEYRKAGDIEQAIAICREYLPQQPGHMSGHIVYGQALFEARQVEEAKAVFETALSLDPENLIALRHLGDLALLIGDSQGARTWYGRVLEADPRNEEIQAQLASLDQSASGAPTPLSMPAVPAAPSPAPPAARAPTPSSAPTVVVSAVKKPQPWAKTVETPRPVVSFSETPTVEVKLGEIPPAPPSAPPAPPQEIEKSQDMTLGLEPTSVPPSSPPASAAPPTLEIDVPVSESNEAPPIDSFSLEGLETTSLAASPAPNAEPAAPADPPAPVVPPAAAPAPIAAAPTPPPPAASAPAEDLPLLDIGEIPSAPVATTPPVAAQAHAFAEPLAMEAPAPVTAPPEPEPEAPMLDDWSPLPTAEPVAATAPAAADSGPFVTETMAELYLAQGHREEALRVYRALLDQRPNDASLIAKVASLSRPAESLPPAPSHVEPHAEAYSGPTIRELLNAIAARRPGLREGPRENGATPQASPATLAELPPSLPESPALAAPAGALATLFGGVAIAAADEEAATALAYAFMDLNGLENGAPRSEQISGAPARPATNELSLDAVFKSGDAPQPAAPTSFSFDQFFSQRATSEQPIAPSGAPAASAGESREDVTQFTQWLEDLKQR